MLLKKINYYKIYKIIFYFTIIFFFSLLSFAYKQDIFAQSCSRSTCSDTADCNNICSSVPYGWGCLTNPGPTCCTCLCGWASSNSIQGPIWCADMGRDDDANGCNPCGGGITPGVTIQPPATNTPTPPSYWLCKRPYAQSPPKCDYEQVNYCVNFDIPGGLCYHEEANCESGCIPPEGTTITPLPTMDPLCTFAPGRQGINTAIGCIPTDSNNDFTIFILRWSVGVSSGIVFLLIIYSAFLIMGSGGNAEKVKAGKELMTAALTGLILLIFSVFILDIFGIRIFRIPGL